MLVAAVTLTGSNWQLPANVEGTRVTSDQSGGCGPIRGRGYSDTGQWEVEAGLCQYWHNLGYTEQRGRLGTRPNSKADEGGSFLSSTQLPDKNLKIEHVLQPRVSVE